jgi:methionyl-tRNA synthetase
MPEFTPTQLLVIVLLSIWSLIWKGIALWKAAKHRQMAWFVCLLPLNTIGLLEIIYLNFFQKDRN